MHHSAPWCAGLALLLCACTGVISPSGSKADGDDAPGVSPSGAGGGPSGAVGDPGLPPVDMPASAPLRRLTRAQYDNTVRDLLGIDAHPAADFGLDEQGGGFASNFKAPVELLQVERYQQAAEELAEQADLALLAPCALPGGDEAQCLEEFLAGFGTRAYRRPLSAEELAAHRQLFSTAGDFAGGIRLVLSTMLQSPYFLYRPELGNPLVVENDGLPLTAYELASRLSYLLQNTMPDAELFAAAAASALQTPEQLADQVRRLLAAPAASDTFVSFYEQWLEVEDLGDLEKNTEIYPAFTAELKSALQSELHEFVEHAMREGEGRLSTLLTADFSFLSGPLYELYGLPQPDAATSGAVTQVTLPAGQRAGLFTLASVMARHSHPDQSSPVKRGYMVLDKLLCTVPPPPPANVDITVPEVDPSVPTSVRFEQHRVDPACASCHSLMDPLGMAFEHYDGIGRYRPSEAGLPVDASLELTGTDQDGPVQNAVELMSKLAAAAEVRDCMARQWFRYAFGRADEPEDAGAILAASSALAGSDQRIGELLAALTSSRGFRYRKPVVQ